MLNQRYLKFLLPLPSPQRLPAGRQGRGRGEGKIYTSFFSIKIFIALWHEVVAKEMASEKDH